MNIEKMLYPGGRNGPEKLDTSWGERGKGKKRTRAIKLGGYDWEGRRKIWTSGRIDTNRMFQPKCAR